MDPTKSRAIALSSSTARGPSSHWSAGPRGEASKDQFVSDDRLSDEIHTNGYTQIHTDEQTHTHKHTHTPYKHLHAHKRHTAYIHPHTHTHSRTSAYNQTHTSPTHTDPYAFYLSRLSLPHAHSSAPCVCSFNLSKLFPCGVIRPYNFFGRMRTPCVRCAQVIMKGWKLFMFVRKQATKLRNKQPTKNTPEAEAKLAEFRAVLKR